MLKVAGQQGYCSSPKIWYVRSVKLEFIAEGAQECPLIRLYSFDQHELLRLSEIVEALSKGSVQNVVLNEQPGIEPVGSCEFTLRAGERDMGVMQIGPRKFDCVLTPDGWECVKELIDPFFKATDGYQWLSEEGNIPLLLSNSGSW
jgi:hypothetical protein